MSTDDEAVFRDALQGLRRGDFSRLEPLFVEKPGGGRPAIVEWCEQGRFDHEPEALAEALSCASFNGRTAAAEYLLKRGVNPSGGAGTGMNALHWAVNRGQLEAVRLLLRHKAPLETRSSYDGTVLGTAVWSAAHEPRPAHAQIVKELLEAGAKVTDAEYPSGVADIDALLRHYGAS